MIRIVISGICGRMGKRIASLAAKDKRFEIKAGLEHPGHPDIGKYINNVLDLPNINGKIESDFNKICTDCDVLIEFTNPDATMQHLEMACVKNVAMVIGTTALSQEQINRLNIISDKIPIVFSPNMSIGANLLFKLTEMASMSLGRDYDVRIIEAHHAQKKDAPSGTAKRLGELISKIRGMTPLIDSIREGDIVGDHTVIFEGKEEKIELKHSAYSRDAFAKGALDAAEFLMGRSPGLYTMQDVIKGLG